MLMIRLKEGNTEDVVWRTGRLDHNGIFSGCKTFQRYGGHIIDKTFIRRYDISMVGYLMVGYLMVGYLMCHFINKTTDL